jgi:hypothetical protein
MIVDIWRQQAGKYFCIARKTSSGFRQHFFTRGEWDDALALVERRKDVDDVYFSVNAYSEPKRRNDVAVRGRWLYADLDEVRPHDLSLRPTIAIRTSPKRYQGFWRCDDVVSDDLAERLVDALGADDDSHALNKVLRIPGTFNYKRDKPARVYLLWDDGPTYRVSRLERELPEKRKAATRAGGDIRVRANESASVKELRHAYGVRNIYMSHAGNRSAAIYGIWSPMVKRGASLEQIMRVLEASWSWQSKLDDGGNWCEREIERIEDQME